MQNYTCGAFCRKTPLDFLKKVCYTDTTTLCVARGSLWLTANKKDVKLVAYGRKNRAG